MRSPEEVLPRSIKQVLLAVMVMMILVLALAGESAGNGAFLYVGF